MTARCKFSAYAHQMLRPSYPDRRGFIVGESRDQKCWRIQWDGNRTSCIYHKSFIDRDDGVLSVTIELGGAPFLSDALRRLSTPVAGPMRFDSRGIPSGGMIAPDGSRAGLKQ